jgi:hypothetical protein
MKAKTTKAECVECGAPLDEQLEACRAGFRAYLTMQRVLQDYDLADAAERRAIEAELDIAWARRTLASCTEDAERMADYLHSHGEVA